MYQILQMEIFFHVSWHFSFSGDAYCDQTAIESGELIGVDGALEFESGCSGEISDMK